MKKILSFLLIACALFLPGCIEGDLSQIGIVKGVAFDLGQTAQYKMTLYVLGKDGGAQILSAEGDTIGDMKAEIAKQTSKYPFGGHNQIVFISDQVPSAEYIVHHFASSEGQRNGAEYIAIVKGQAAQCLTWESQGGAAPVEIVGVIDDAQDNGEILRATAFMVKNASQGIGNTITVPYCAVEEERFRVLGMAALNNYRVTGILTEEEAIGAKLLLSSADRIRLTVDAGQDKADLELRDVKVDVKVRDQGYDVRTEALVETECKGERRELLAAAEAYIGTCIQKAFAAAQEKGDFLNLAAKTLNHNPAGLEKYKNSWQERLREMDLTVEVKLK